MGLRVFLDEITDLNAAQSDNIQKFHNLLAISQMNTRKKFRSFQLLPRETDRQQNWHFCLKILLDMGSLSVIQTLLAYSDSMQEDLFTGRSKNMQEVINFTIRNTLHH